MRGDSCVSPFHRRQRIQETLEYRSKMIQAINTEDCTPILTQRKSWNMLKPQISILFRQPFTSSVNDPGLSCLKLQFGAVANSFNPKNPRFFQSNSGKTVIVKRGGIHHDQPVLGGAVPLLSVYITWYYHIVPVLSPPYEGWRPPNRRRAKMQPRTWHKASPCTSIPQKLFMVNLPLKNNMFGMLSE